MRGEVGGGGGGVGGLDVEDDGGGVDGFLGAGDAALLDGVVGGAEACGVEEAEGESVKGDGVFDDVAGGAVDVADDGAVFVKDSVKQ